MTAQFLSELISLYYVPHHICSSWKYIVDEKNVLTFRLDHCYVFSMSMRRARLNVKPNIGGPKPRVTAAKHSSKEDVLPPAELSTSDVTESNVGNYAEKEASFASTSRMTEEQTETKADKPKTMRRAAAKPMPNISGRGTIRSKIVEDATSESNPSTKNGFTTIKPAHIESTANQATEQENPESMTNEQNKAVPDKCEVAQESKLLMELGDNKEATTEDNKKENRQRFRSRFAKARPNIEAVSRPRIRYYFSM